MVNLALDMLHLWNVCVLLTVETSHGNKVFFEVSENIYGINKTIFKYALGS